MDEKLDRVLSYHLIALAVNVAVLGLIIFIDLNPDTLEAVQMILGALAWILILSYCVLAWSSQLEAENQVITEQEEKKVQVDIGSILRNKRE